MSSQSLLKNLNISKLKTGNKIHVETNKLISLGYSYTLPRIGILPSVISGLGDTFTNIKYATYPLTQDIIPNTYVQVYGFWEPNTEHFSEEYTIVDKDGDKIQYKSIYKALGLCTLDDSTQTVIDGSVSFGVTGATGKYIGSKLATMEFLSDPFKSRIIKIYK